MPVDRTLRHLGVPDNARFVGLSIAAGALSMIVISFYPSDEEMRQTVLAAAK